MFVVVDDKGREVMHKDSEKDDKWGKCESKGVN
jgi:hypothetical protein